MCGRRAGWRRRWPGARTGASTWCRCSPRARDGGRPRPATRPRWRRCGRSRRPAPWCRRWVCHATYLINLASPDDAVWARSRDCLVENLRVASGIGATALVLHVGSHLGAGLDARLAAVAAALREALDAVPDGCDVLLENAAGAGGTVGRTVDELAAVVDALDGDGRVGLCLDSQHLWASGIPFATPEEMDAVLRRADRLVGLDRLRCLHLNDSAVPRRLHQEGVALYR